MNTLFTSVGRRVELMRAFRRAYRALRLPGNVVGLDCEPLAPALRFCDRRYVVPRTDEPGFLPRLLEICRGEEIGLVFALIDPDIVRLAQWRAEIEATGARLAVVSAAAAKLCADKWLTHAFFQRLGLAVPRSWLPGDPALERLEPPLFIKPRQGSSSHHAFRVRTREELRVLPALRERSHHPGVRGRAGDHQRRGLRPRGERARGGQPAPHRGARRRGGQGRDGARPAHHRGLRPAGAGASRRSGRSPCSA
ncbi:MAG: hypothetical protein QM765_17360 [Myxococcales bacterium]